MSLWDIKHVEGGDGGGGGGGHPGPRGRPRNKFLHQSVASLPPTNIQLSGYLFPLTCPRAKNTPARRVKRPDWVGSRVRFYSAVEFSPSCSPPPPPCVCRWQVSGWTSASSCSGNVRGSSLHGCSSLKKGCSFPERSCRSFEPRWPTRASLNAPLVSGRKSFRPIHTQGRSILSRQRAGLLWGCGALIHVSEWVKQRTSGGHVMPRWARCQWKRGLFPMASRRDGSHTKLLRVIPSRPGLRIHQNSNEHLCTHTVKPLVIGYIVNQIYYLGNLVESWCFSWRYNPPCGNINLFQDSRHY